MSRVTENQVSLHESLQPYVSILIKRRKVKENWIEQREVNRNGY